MSLVPVKGVKVALYIPTSGTLLVLIVFVHSHDSSKVDLD